ncbi:LOW QUALITY PROTEIN: hypothetical protein V1477_020455 [Vespula maculifrons]|uniref:Uncharacterized protein n=1 Tax=Vespula maculifrons TaxID=7453 RepID=A0ABD2AM74_VESMC
MTLTVTSLVVLWYSARVHRNFRRCHSSKLKCEVGILGFEERQQCRINLRSGDTRLRERTTKTDLRPTFRVSSSVVFWTSTRELRKFRGAHSCKYYKIINLRSGDTRLRERKTKTGLRPPLTVTSSVVFWTSTRELRKISWRSFQQINLRSGDTRLRERKTKTGLRPPLTVTSSVVFGTSTRELRKISWRSFQQINLRSGDTRLRERKTKTGLRPPLTVTSSVVFWTSTRELRKISWGSFQQINLRSGDTRLRERTTKTGLRPTLTVTSSVVFWTSTRELRKFRGAHSCKYYRIIKLRSGDSRQRERKTKTGLRPPLTVTSSVVFGTSTRELRKISWRSFQQINLRSGDTRLRERKTKTGLRPPLTVTSSVVFGTSTRELRKISWRSFQQINLRSGDTRLRERKTKTGLRPPLTVTSSVVFGTSTRELRKISWRSIQQINLRSGDTRLRERKTKTGLRSPLTVTSSVVLWTSTRELRKFRGAHSCNLYDFRLNCEVGIFGCERRQQSCAFDRLSSITIVQSCFGLRRGNIEIFAGCYSSEYSRRVYANFYVALSRDLEFISTSGLRNFCTPAGL